MRTFNRGYLNTGSFCSEFNPRIQIRFPTKLAQLLRGLGDLAGGPTLNSRIAVGTLS